MYRSSNAENIGNLTWNSIESCVKYWKDIYGLYGYSINVTKRDTNEYGNERVELTCKHGGGPKSTVPPDNRQRETFSQKTNCSFKVICRKPAKLEIVKVCTTFNLQHTCIPRPLDRVNHINSLVDLPEGALERAITLFNCNAGIPLVRGILKHDYKITLDNNVLDSIRCKIGNSVRAGNHQ